MLIATKKTLKNSYLILISISKSTYMFTACSLSNFSSEIKSAMLILELFYVPLPCWQNKKMRCKGICKSCSNFVAGWEEDTNELEPKPIHPEMQRNCTLKNKNTHQWLPVKKRKMQGQI